MAIMEAIKEMTPTLDTGKFAVWIFVIIRKAFYINPFNFHYFTSGPFNPEEKLGTYGIRRVSYDWFYRNLQIENIFKSGWHDVKNKSYHMWSAGKIYIKPKVVYNGKKFCCFSRQNNWN